MTCIVGYDCAPLMKLESCPNQTSPGARPPMEGLVTEYRPLLQQFRLGSSSIQGKPTLFFQQGFRNHGNQDDHYNDDGSIYPDRDPIVSSYRDVSWLRIRGLGRGLG